MFQKYTLALQFSQVIIRPDMPACIPVLYTGELQKTGLPPRWSIFFIDVFVS